MLRPWIKLLCMILIALAFAGSVALAQSDPANESGEPTLTDRWDITAKRAEEAIANQRASNDALEALRAEVAAQRNEAFAIIERDNIEVLTLRAQIRALGQPPKNGEAETPATAARRAELTEAFDRANEPLLAARQAYNRSEVLIVEIDKLIRSRQQSELLARAPSPMVPTRWLPALTEFATYSSTVLTEAQTIIEHPTQGLVTRQRAPISVLLALAGLVVLFFLQPRALAWIDMRVGRARSELRNRALVSAALALRLVLPSLAAGLLLAALFMLDLTLYSARSFNTVALSFALFPIVFYWLGQALFAPSLPEYRSIPLPDEQAQHASRLCLGLGVTLAAEQFLESMERDYTFTPATSAVMAAFVVAMGSFFLWHLARLLARKDETEVGAGGATETEEELSALRPRALVVYLIRLAVIAAIVFVAIGYVQIARKAMVPMILSLGLLAFALAIYRLLVSISHAALHEERAISALLPVAAGMLVAIATLPIFALIWGARQADLTEIWTLMTQGVEVGETRISFSVVFVLLAVFAIGVFATRWLQRLLETTVLPGMRLDSGGRNAVVTGLGYVGIILSALIAISAAGLDLSNLAIVAGALSVGIGFGLQAIVSNFISGIILLVERPIKEGDWIEVAGQSGIVRKISVRSTRIETFDRHEVIVPNGDLITGTVTNMTLSSRTGRLIVPVGVAYGSDLDKTRDILLAAAKAHKQVLQRPEPTVLFMGLGESSLDFELRCFLNDVYSVLSARSELLFEIYRELGKAGIEIPFPQRDVSLRNIGEIAAAVSAAGAGKKAET